MWMLFVTKKNLEVQFSDLLFSVSVVLSLSRCTTLFCFMNLKFKNCTIRKVERQYYDKTLTR